MDKKWIICIIITIIVGVIGGIVLSIFLNNNDDELQGTDLIGHTELADENNTELNNNFNTIETSNTEDKISPNAILIKKEYFKDCDHLIREVEDIPEELINGTQEDIEKMYSDWEIEDYNNNEITLYKEENGNCGEHYFVQDHYGVIGIYTVNENDEKTLKEDTEISTKYLPEADLEKLQEGIEIVGKTKLVEFLEDYE